MPSDKICKTVHQYNKIPVPEKDMKKFQEIAEDCRTVKNYVYERFGGISALPKLYPGYTIQNEMTKSGLRERLDLPSVYFYLAVFDALGDIKSQWSRVKSKIAELIFRNENFSPEEKHYLRFVLKVNNLFEAVLNQTLPDMPEEIHIRYEELAGNVDISRMHRYLCRQVRKYLVRLQTDMAAGFPIGERAYRYADHGIYISTKEKRKRVFVELTDNNQYKSQLYIKLYPEQNRLEILVPVYMTARKHEDYTGETGVSLGMRTMLTTDSGNRYGGELGASLFTYADWIREQTGIYNNNRKNNPGRKKYYAKKRRYEEQMHSYINHELNRFLQTEKPQIVYLPKFPKSQKGGVNRRINHTATVWQRGYIRRQLIQKCREQSVKLVEVFAKDIGVLCSRCGAFGQKSGEKFICPNCGYEDDHKTNAAQNAKKRGMETTENTQRSYE